MKEKLLLEMALTAVLAMGLTACGEEEATVVASNESATIEGFVTYNSTVDSETTNGVAAKNATVNLTYHYDLPANGDTTTVNLNATAQTDNQGWYSFKLNVPAGKSADYEIEVSFTANNDDTNANGDDITDTKCLFTGNTNGTIAYGSRVVENIAATSQGMIEKGYGNED